MYICVFVDENYSDVIDYKVKPDDTLDTSTGNHYLLAPA